MTSTLQSRIVKAEAWYEAKGHQLPDVATCHFYLYCLVVLRTGDPERAPVALQWLRAVVKSTQTTNP